MLTAKVKARSHNGSIVKYEVSIVLKTMENLERSGWLLTFQFANFPLFLPCI